MAVFYPSVVVNFRVVFDDTLTITVSLPTASTVDATAKSAGGFSKPAVQPLVTGRGRQSQIMARVPKSASVEFPGHRPAGSFNLTFDFKELPIDPRTVKSAAVDIFIGTVEQSAFAEGMKGQSKRSVLDTSARNPHMVGLVDKWEVTHGENGSEVKMSGRDLRGFLIDTPIATDPKEGSQILDSLNMLLPLDEVLRELLSKHPLTAGIKIAANPGEWDAGVVPSPHGIGGRSVPRHRKGAKGTKAGGRASAAGSQEKLTFWDLIVKLSYMCGAIPHFVGAQLRVRPARSLYDRKFAGFDPLIPTPFADGAPRRVDKESNTPITPLSQRKMVYGRDIEEIRFERKFGGFQRPHQVCVVSLDDDSPLKRGTDRQIIGRYPPNEIVTKVAASGQKAMSEQLWIRAPAGISDVDQLTRIAEATYNEIGRGEVGGTCTTHTLASFGGDNQDADLLTLQPGDVMQFGTDVRPLRTVAPLISEYTDHLRIPFEKQVQAIAQRLGDENLARVILATAAGQINEVQSYFRVASVSYDWGEDGMKVSFDFQNFIEASFEQNSTRPTPSAVQETSVPDQELGGL